MIIKYNLTAVINPEDEMKLRYELDDVALKYSGALSSGHESINDSSEEKASVSWAILRRANK